MHYFIHMLLLEGDAECTLHFVVQVMFRSCTLHIDV